MDDIYSVGTFAQVHEVQDLGNRMRLVVMAHRRIKIVNQIFEDGNAKSEQGKESIYVSLYLCASYNKIQLKNRIHYYLFNDKILFFYPFKLFDVSMIILFVSQRK